MLVRIGRCCLSLVVLNALLVLAAGCGGSTATVSGKVKYAGNEMDGGTVLLVDEKNTVNIRAKIASDGSYSAPGVPYGTVKVGVEPVANAKGPFTKAPGDKSNMPEDKAAMMFGKATGTFVDIPAAYRNPDTSKITVTVDSGQKTFNIDIPVK
jgi:hypothetical protein